MVPPQAKVLVALILFVLFDNTSSKSIIETLPGYHGALPFKLETGYVSVGKSDEVQLFYYFIESERNPVKDPLLLWLTGGPGCSSFSGLVYEIGPIVFDFQDFDESLPSLLPNPYSWTKIANILFVDAPVGAGFSYSTSSEGYYSSDTKSANDTYKFLKKWLLNHPKFIKNPLYIAGDSYAGIPVPMIVLEVSNGNDAGQVPHMNLKGYILGNPATDMHSDTNSKVKYAHRMGFISDEYYQSAKIYCNGEYVNPHPNNAPCIDYLQIINECTKNINDAHILEPKCDFFAPKPDGLKLGPQFLEDISIDILIPSRKDELWCRTGNHRLSYVWANDPRVQEALHIRNGTITNWVRCNKSVAYDSNVPSVFEYHQILSKKGYRALVYSGDHDMIVPYVGTYEWITNLNLTIEDNWRPWFHNGQVAGFTEKYKEARFSLTFATVKGGGHTAPEFKPEECFAMVDRWLAYYII